MSSMTIAAASGNKTGVRNRAAVPQCPTKLFIGGITKNTSTEVLRQHFCNFGRVLDCVAMRREDGRSRGFGYVTLDSAQAAERCLAAPQVIDGRVVDLKRAVPEGSTEVALKAATRLRTQGCAGQKRQQRASILSTPAPFPDPLDILSTASPMLTMMWPGAPAQSHWGVEAMDNSENLPDFATLLSAGTSSPSWHSAAGMQRLLSTAPSPTEQWKSECSPETPTNASVLSASAPEFVPKVTDSADRASAEEVEKPAERSALGDITNIHDQASLKKTEHVIPAAKKVQPPPGLQQADASLEPASIPWQPDEEISPTSQASTYDPLSPSQWSNSSSLLLSTTPLASAQKQISITEPETRTISTQTEEEEEEEVEAGMSKTAEVSSISREKLLSLRPRKTECKLGFRTISR
eukprot:TRINITY_DN104_c0_g1_i1.p1 TRINITY_DN104_c0_g1~~TRINITY_DN104_c0_g1_i1.p1  ORF type:complete len:408 (+),score=80.16 TRINITY_DN104_c0_g1_i1:58-1281(+)